MEDRPREDVLAAIDALVDELLERAGIREPPVDAIALAQRHLGMVVCLDRRQPTRGRVQRAGGQSQIYLRPEPREERHQWTVARQIGESLKPQLYQRLGWDADTPSVLTGESLLNLFSSHLLIPTRWFAQDAFAYDNDLLKLKKERYRTASHEVLALRFLDLPEPCVITIVDNEQIHRRKSNGPRVPQELTPVERKCQRYVHRYGRSRTVQEKGWTVYGWPVHQNDWKREILRSLVQDGAAWLTSEEASVA
jgi:hypothetical protein